VRTETLLRNMQKLAMRPASQPPCLPYGRQGNGERFKAVGKRRLA